MNKNSLSFCRRFAGDLQGLYPRGGSDIAHAAKQNSYFLHIIQKVKCCFGLKNATQNSSLAHNEIKHLANLFAGDFVVLKAMDRSVGLDGRRQSIREKNRRKARYSSRQQGHCCQPSEKATRQNRRSAAISGRATS